VIDVAIIAHHERGGAAEIAERTAAWAVERGHRAWVVPTDAAALGVDQLASERPPSDADLVLSLGGDGTMLRAVHLLEGAPVPLLGVNMGWLGYLTEVEAHQVHDSLDRFVLGPEAGRWHLDERLMLDVRAIGADGGEMGRWRALNEAVVEKSESGHTVRLLVRIDGEPFTSYAADGMIVSTPTGSTAYSLSARGPVVSPRHRAILVTPVAPHMLFDRSLVLDPTEHVEVEVIGHRRAELAVDGQRVTSLHEGEIASCRPSEATARFVRFGEWHYHQILKAKFGLADR
jgi:NAD+ kinase